MHLGGDGGVELLRRVDASTRCPEDKHQEPYQRRSLRGVCKHWSVNGVVVVVGGAEPRVGKVRQPASDWLSRRGDKTAKDPGLL